MIKLLEIKDLQDIYIVGMDYNGKALAAVSINDDYCSVTAFDGKKKSRMETDGAAYIIAEAEFVKHQSRIRETYDTRDSDLVYIKLPNFTGSIDLSVFNDNGEDVINEDNYKPDEMVTYLDFGDDWYSETIIRFNCDLKKGKLQD